MATQAGVGYSITSSSVDAGVEAAEMALSEAATSSPQVAMIFHTAKHDPRQFHAGVRSVLGGDVRLLGGFTGGVITRDYLGYDGYESAVAVLSSWTVLAFRHAHRHRDEANHAGSWRIYPL